MPFPILILAGAALVKAAAALKTGAVIVKAGTLAAKGAPVVAKALAGKGALVSRTVLHATQTYGALHVAAFAAVATMTVGAAVILYEKTERLVTALDKGDLLGALRSASSLYGELQTAGGLTDVSGLLDRFVAEHGSNPSTVAEVAQKAQGLLHALTDRIKKG